MRYQQIGGLALLLLIGCGRPMDLPTPAPGLSTVTLPTATPRTTHAPGQRTPAPTFTPAPTPTPIIHIVEPGDTLLDIANRYGVTLDALQTVNGVLRPETLQIGQSLIIPSNFGSQPVPNQNGLLLPTPAPLPVIVQGAALYESPAGSIWVLGELLNPNETALENAQVRVVLLDASGAELASGGAFVALDVIPTRSASPFGVLFATPPLNVASFEATAIRAEASSEPGARYMPIAIAEEATGLDGLQFQVNGRLANQGPRHAIEVSVVLTTYDAQDRVTGYRQQVVGDGMLPAGASTMFAVSIAPFGSAGAAPARYTLAAQGRSAP
jgi:LysM repeat protein